MIAINETFCGILNNKCPKWGLTPEFGLVFFNGPGLTGKLMTWNRIHLNQTVIQRINHMTPLPCSYYHNKKYYFTTSRLQEAVNTIMFPLLPFSLQLAISFAVNKTSKHWQKNWLLRVSDGILLPYMNPYLINAIKNAFYNQTCKCKLLPQVLMYPCINSLSISMQFGNSLKRK